MNSRQIQINLCYILHSRPYQDNSLIIQCLSWERGLISILSKGARSSKKQLLSLLQPFQSLSISYLGKGDLYILTGVELHSQVNSHISTPLLKGKSIYCAYYINELILRLLPIEETNPDLFSLYQKTLHKLQNTDSIEIVLRIFEIRLLAILGYELNLQYDIHTGKKIKENINYYYDPLSGPYEIEDKLLCNSKQQITCVSGKTLLAISFLDFESQQVKKESKLLLRQVLQNHLGDKPLKSREVYRQLYS
jgi:DNA repair protein RecO (recombination protein O)